ncbi:Armadillo repeat-containing protein 6 [Saguinus oedipus]|uniref:Armadillo repeat-containing protein 6 n=1 Tax=Saguinus oedipus TaxID=9490 RepID=A0ABQ9TSN0_SAGOE|nr:Armadillo repeat-containing protein 6 [Saguinus oedipus]
MASKCITQETFDAAVRENIEEFAMGPEEAVKEAMEQFESQGASGTSKSIQDGKGSLWGCQQVQESARTRRDGSPKGEGQGVPPSPTSLPHQARQAALAPYRTDIMACGSGLTTTLLPLARPMARWQKHPIPSTPCVDVASVGMGRWEASGLGWSQQKDPEVRFQHTYRDDSCRLLSDPWVDLSNIVKTVPKVSADGPQEPTHDVLQTLSDLQESVASSRPQEVSAHLTHFCDQCKQDKACCFLAAQKGAYPIIFAAWKLATASDQGLLLQSLNALSVLTDGQPDLLDMQGLQLLVATLAQNADEADLTCSGIRCVRHACLKHEQNRQELVKAGVLPLLTGAIVHHGHHANVVREACWALRVMTFNDDMRMSISHAHDHAKMIVQENRGLKVLIEATKAFLDNPGILSELCGTLSRLAVRNEFCREVVDLGGLSILVSLLTDYNDHQELVKQLLSALRAIAGNDDVKDAIVHAGGMESIMAAMTRHLASPQVPTSGAHRVAGQWLASRFSFCICMKIYSPAGPGQGG